MDMTALKELAAQGEKRALERAHTGFCREYALLSATQLENQLQCVRAVVQSKLRQAQAQQKHGKSADTSRYAMRHAQVELAALEGQLLVAGL